MTGVQTCALPISPYYWQVRGSGFWANEACTLRDVETDGPGLWIYTKDSCGVCYVWCNDGCSDQSWLIKSVVGQWVSIAVDDCSGVQLNCGPANLSITSGTTNTCIQSKYKIVEEWAVGGYVCLADASYTGPLTQELIDTAAANGCETYPSRSSCAFSTPTGWTACPGTAFWQLSEPDPYWGCTGSLSEVDHYRIWVGEIGRASRRERV